MAYSPKSWFREFYFKPTKINFIGRQKENSYSLILILSIFYNSCKSIQKESYLFHNEPKGNPNLVFYLGEPFRPENSFFDSQKISIHRNKKNLSNLVIQTIQKKENYFCESLPLGFHKFDFQISISRKLNGKGKESIYMKESGFLNSPKTHLLYMAPNEYYILAPKLSGDTKWDIPNTILYFYLFPLFPFGYFPYYERDMEMKFIPIENKDDTQFFKECCSPKRKTFECENQILKIIESNGDLYGNTASRN